MSKICPDTGEKVIYLECLECDTKSCEKMTATYKHNRNNREKKNDNRHKDTVGNKNI